MGTGRGRGFLARPFAHFVTITRHRHAVVRNCFRAGIFWQGLLHDLSKYSPAEFLPGAKYYQGNRSPNVGERIACGYSSAWLHHKGRNKHHYEYWTDYNMDIHRTVPVKMPLKYLKEMVCDRIAASKIYKKDSYTDASPLEYYLRGHDGRIMHDDTAALLEALLTLLRDRGEDVLFACLRAMKEPDYAIPEAFRSPTEHNN